MLVETNLSNLGAFGIQKDIRIPNFSKELAEFIGIVIGDGGVTERQLKITLDSVTDAEYINYVAELITELFGVIPSIRKRTPARAVDITISRTKLVAFLNQIGISTGNKTYNQIDVPSWILEDKNLSRSCLRGLMDTDGCVYLERHIIKNTKYNYPRIAFVNSSKPLLVSVQNILSDIGFGAKIRGNRSVMLENRQDVIRYFKEVGTHNPKHANRFFEFTGESAIVV